MNKRRLSIFRHAKSSWKTGEEDFDRPLNDRGRQATPEMAAHISQTTRAPDLILCSPSVRTRETLELAMPAFSPEPRVKFLDSLYHAATVDLLSAIHDVSDKVRHLMIIGHNPGLEMIALKLADPDLSDDDALGRLASKFPTAGWALLVFEDIAWKKLPVRSGSLVHFATPRSLSGG